MLNEIIVGVVGTVVATIIIAIGAWGLKRLYPIIKAKKINGFVPKRVSTPSPEKSISNKNTPSDEKTASLFQRMSQSTAFFSDRFSSAFPGCRDICEFDNPKEAMTRLDILLQAPLRIKVKNSSAGPFWWSRGGATIHIDSYRRLKKMFFSTDEFLINDVDHYKLKRIVAVDSCSYFQKFVYVEVEGLKSSGLYDLSSSLTRRGYAREEYGLYKKRKVTREEYDDGATIIKGKVKQIAQKVKLRVGTIGKYNFLISAHASPINNSSADAEIRKILDRILVGESDIPELKQYISRLPKNRMDL